MPMKPLVYSVFHFFTTVKIQRPTIAFLYAFLVGQFSCQPRFLI